MTCEEFQQVLPDVLQGRRTAEQDSHLHACSACSGLVADLTLITRDARTLHSSEEPSPTVWNAIASEIRAVESDCAAIAQEARLLQASEEPGPRVWNAIAGEVRNIESECELIAGEARTLQASEEPGPRVWNALSQQITQVETELSYIAQEARGLRGSSEPSPRVWNSIEIALRQEGLIRQPRERIPVRPRRWAWLIPVPVAALLLIGLFIYQQVPDQPQIAFAPQATGAPAFEVTPAANSDDEQVLDAISQRAPQLRAAYESELANVNAYIRDAKMSAESDPNDEQAQQYLMDAYEQKAMVYEMALDRSLP